MNYMKENQKNGVRLPFWIGLIIFVSLIMFSLQRGYILRHASHKTTPVKPVMQQTNSDIATHTQYKKTVTKTNSVNSAGNDTVDIQFTGLRMK
jgi:hypothetical protein